MAIFKRLVRSLPAFSVECVCVCVCVDLCMYVFVERATQNSNLDITFVLLLSLFSNIQFLHRYPAHDHAYTTTIIKVTATIMYSGVINSSSAHANSYLHFVFIISPNSRHISLVAERPPNRIKLPIHKFKRCSSTYSS